MMIENRKVVRRWELLLFLPVVNADNGEVLGRIADITTDGIMMFSDRSLALGEVYNLMIRKEDLMETLLAGDISDADVYFKGKVRWLDEQPPLNRIGLQFEELDSDSHTAFRQIVRNVAHNLAS